MTISRFLSLLFIHALFLPSIGLATPDYDQRLSPPSARIDVIIDADMYNEIDDMFALAYAALSPQQINLKAVYAAPFLNDRSNSPLDGMEKSYEETLRVLRLLNIDPPGFAFRGSSQFLQDSKTPVDSPAARHLIKLAHQPRKGPLYVVALGAPTNLASALLIDPTIIDKVVMVWIGGPWNGKPDFNLKQDIPAAQVLFDSGVPLVRISSAVASTLETTLPELEAALDKKSHLADNFYHTVAKYYTDTAGFKWATRDGPNIWKKVIWDVATIAWLIEPEVFVKSKVIPSASLSNEGAFLIDQQNRHPYRLSTDLDRDRIFTDLFEKLRKSIE